MKFLTQITLFLGVLGGFLTCNDTMPMMARTGSNLAKISLQRPTLALSATRLSTIQKHQSFTQAAPQFKKSEDQKQNGKKDRFNRFARAGTTASLIGASAGVQYLMDKKEEPKTIHVATQLPRTCQQDFEQYGRSILIFGDECLSDYDGYNAFYLPLLNTLKSKSALFIIPQANMTTLRYETIVPHLKDWDVYESDYAQTTYNLFIPKHWNADVDPQEKLGVDLTHFHKVEDSENYFIKVKKLSFSYQSNMISTIKNLFAVKSSPHIENNYPWNICLIGHGSGLSFMGYQTLAGMEHENFMKLLKFFNTISTKIVAYTSCGAGDPRGFAQIFKKETFNYPLVCAAYGGHSIYLDNVHIDRFGQQLNNHRKLTSEHEKEVMLAMQNFASPENWHKGLCNIRWAQTQYFQPLAQPICDGIKLWKEAYLIIDNENNFYPKLKIDLSNPLMKRAVDKLSYYEGEIIWSNSSSRYNSERMHIGELELPSVNHPDQILSEISEILNKNYKLSLPNIFIDKVTLANNKTIKNVLISDKDFAYNFDLPGFSYDYKKLYYQENDSYYCAYKPFGQRNITTKRIYSDDDWYEPTYQYLVGSNHYLDYYKSETQKMKSTLLEQNTIEPVQEPMPWHARVYSAAIRFLISSL